MTEVSYHVSGSLCLPSKAKLKHGILYVCAYARLLFGLDPLYVKNNNVVLMFKTVFYVFYVYFYVFGMVRLLAYECITI